jgi:hypothetical protein
MIEIFALRPLLPVGAETFVVEVIACRCPIRYLMFLIGNKAL